MSLDNTFDMVTRDNDIDSRKFFFMPSEDNSPYSFCQVNCPLPP